VDAVKNRRVAVIDDAVNRPARASSQPSEDLAQAASPKPLLKNRETARKRSGRRVLAEPAQFLSPRCFSNPKNHDEYRRRACAHDTPPPLAAVFDPVDFLFVVVVIA